MADPEIVNANKKITSLYFHIIHRAVYIDTNSARCIAFIKRLLQMTLLFSPSKACGALIVVNKILKSKPDIRNFSSRNLKIAHEPSQNSDRKAADVKFESDDEGDEQYKDVDIDESGKVIAVASNESESNAAKSSWIHMSHSQQQKIDVQSQIKTQTFYDPHKRSAAFCGAEYTLYYELSLIAKHFHPTIQVFVKDILQNHIIKYYGDPLQDFSLSHFLERFAFKNPKKIDKKEEKSAFRKAYHAKGSRGLSVHLLTDQTCTEEERYIFEFLQRKREIKETKVRLNEQDNDDDDDLESVDDDEFDNYLDSMGAKKEFDKSEEDFDYLSDLQKNKAPNENDSKQTKKKKMASAESDDDDSIGDDEDDWANDDDDDLSELSENEGDNADESGTDQSIDKESDDDNSAFEDDDNDDGEEEEINPRTSKKLKKNGKVEKVKKGKSKNEDEDLFVSVDDFSEMLEKNSSNANHGTLGEIFNKDKSSQKQMDWEEKRHNNFSGFKRKKPFGKSFNNKKKSFNGAKKKRF
jgi:ribosome biogenesis protein MAK21